MAKLTEKIILSPLNKPNTSIYIINNWINMYRVPLETQSRMASTLLTPVGSTWKTNKLGRNTQIWVKFSKFSQHNVTCCVTRFVTWSHRTVTCKRDVVWKAWHCPVTVYCRRISLIFSESFLTQKFEITSHDAESQKFNSLHYNLW